MVYTTLVVHFSSLIAINSFLLVISLPEIQYRANTSVVQHPCASLQALPLRPSVSAVTRGGSIHHYTVNETTLLPTLLLGYNPFQYCNVLQCLQIPGFIRKQQILELIENWLDASLQTQCIKCSSLSGRGSSWSGINHKTMFSNNTKDKDYQPHHFWAE